MHSFANAYKDLCKAVPEIDHLVKRLSGIASFFDSSAKRTTDLEKIGGKEGLTIRRIQNTLKSDGQNLLLLFLIPFCVLGKHL